MNGKIFIVSGCVALTLVSSGGLRTTAEAGQGDTVTDVGVQQQRVQRDFQDLEQKALRVMESIQETDPDRAEQLQAALDWARDKALAGRMGSVADLLNASKVVEAKDLQPGMAADLEAMRRLIRESPGEYDRLQKQVGQAQAWLDTTLELAQDQWRLMRDSEKAQDTAAEQKRLNEQIARVERLLTAQKELRARTEKAQASGQIQLDREADEQRKLAQEAGGLLAAIQGGGRSGRAGPTSPTTGQTSRAGAGGARQTDLPDPDPASNAEAPPAPRPQEVGEKPVSVAIGEQMLATENLAAQKPKAALTNQTQAVEKLELALREIKYELGRQQNLDNQKAKAAQDQVEQKTARMFEDMVQAESRQPEARAASSAPRAKSPNPNSLPGQQPSLKSPFAAAGSGASKPSPSARDISPDFPRGFSTGGNLRGGGLHPESIVEATPGLWNSVAILRPIVNEAEQLMLKASSLLETNALVVAAPVQMDAYTKLSIAAWQLEQWLLSTKDKQRDELRPRLKEMLESMLVQQKAATRRTETLSESKRRGKWTDEDRQCLAAVCEGEKEIGRMAGQASDEVVQDGSSIAFGGLLVELQRALTNVVSLLEAEDAGARTLNTQREAESIMANLIVATEQNIRNVSPKKAKNWVKQPREPTAPPLIPLGTELRLLGAHQARINERTAAIEKEFEASSRQEHRAELLRLSEQQRRVYEMTRDIIKKTADGGNNDHVPL